ncbi:MAG: hypothetical protein IT561_05040 [Alphaproteobacteria bacterium]|nr:hypothetical protein [Alphaproteobacteria bacterium]
MRFSPVVAAMVQVRIENFAVDAIDVASNIDINTFGYPVQPTVTPTFLSAYYGERGEILVSLVGTFQPVVDAFPYNLGLITARANELVLYEVTVTVDGDPWLEFRQMQITGPEALQFLPGSATDVAEALAFILRDDDTIESGAADDTVLGFAGDDIVLGGDGNDLVQGNEGDDDINGNVGADTVQGGSGADFARGGKDDDLVQGGEGDDWHVNGNNGGDSVYGGKGNDLVFGGRDDDLVSGDAGADRISGDLGDDTLVGGLGADTFVFLGGSGDDRIDDFDPATGDRIAVALAINGSGILSASDILARTADGAGGALVDLGDGHSITIAGWQKAQLAEGYFLLL